ncbi:MAG: DUF4124 domain-containing protein [Steroidobacteraceae bacterium]
MRLAIVFAALTLGAALVARADVWMWKDAGGVTHYSDMPVQGAVRVKSITPRPPGAAERAEARPSASGPSTAASGEQFPVSASTAAAVQQDVAQKRAEQCKQAKAEYEKAVAARRIYKTNKNGEREYLNDADADKMRLQARASMDEACGNSGRR